MSIFFKEISEHLPYLGWEVEDTDESDNCIVAFKKQLDIFMFIYLEEFLIGVWAIFEIDKKKVDDTNHLYKIINQLNDGSGVVKWCISTHDDGGVWIHAQLCSHFRYTKASFAQLILDWEADLDALCDIANEIMPFLKDGAHALGEYILRGARDNQTPGTDFDLHLDKLNALTKDTLQ